MKKIEDYLKHYIGCDVMLRDDLNFRSDGNNHKLLGLCPSEVEPFKTIALIDSPGGAFIEHYIEDIKLLLRPLSSMTEEEVKELESTKALQRPSPVHPLAMLVWTAETYRLAVSKHFDIFGLIDANLALDATKIEKV